MSNTTLLPALGLGSMARCAGLAEVAVRLCLNQRRQLCPHVWVPILKPRRPCIRPSPPEQPSSAVHAPPSPFDDLYDDDDDDDVRLPIENRRVVFADSWGLPLTAVRVFSDEGERPDLDPLPSLQGLGSMTGEGYSCTVSTCCPGTWLKLGFPQPSADFRAFRAKLAESMVVLEDCSVTQRALRGTARVRNICFRKEVQVRITFDSWQSCRDVPCVHLQERFGGPQTDVFAFELAFPKVVDAKRRIEFCLSYLPGGHSEPFWDNNGGRNYSIDVRVRSHLRRGENPSERA